MNVGHLWGHRGGHSLPLVTLVFGVGTLMFTLLVGIFSQYFTWKLLEVKWCCWVPAGLIGPMLMLCYSQLWGECVSTLVHLTMCCLGIEVNSSDPVWCGSSRKELFLASAYRAQYQSMGPEGDKCSLRPICYVSSSLSAPNIMKINPWRPCPSLSKHVQTSQNINLISSYDFPLRTDRPYLNNLADEQ